MATTIPTSLGTDETLQPQLDGKIVRIERPPPDLVHPVVLASPHSGREYAAELRAATRLSIAQLRRSEDAYVDQLIDFAPEYGATMVCAEFPRVFVDVNRGAGEVDPDMFSDRIPADLVEPSRRAASGLGVIPRIGAEGRTLYRRRMRYAEAQARLDRYYHPYHNALQGELAALKARFGCVVLADMHSMPAMGARGADIVLGDRFGTSCLAEVTDRIEAMFQGLGLVTVRNTPYAGGFTTEHYGRPSEAVNVIQIEINRALYMDENRVRLTPDHNLFVEKIRSFVRQLTLTNWASLLQP